MNSFIYNELEMKIKIEYGGIVVIWENVQKSVAEEAEKSL